jgi:hypothetical protein
LDVAVVDPSDDSLDRYVVWHYRYDAVRHERRNVVVITFDNEHEFLAEVEHRAALLRERQARGEAEQVEHISGVRKPPGYATEQSRERVEWKLNPSKKARVRKRGRGPH